jgi:hypothetical protein
VFVCVYIPETEMLVCVMRRLEDDGMYASEDLGVVKRGIVSGRIMLYIRHFVIVT